MMQSQRPSINPLPLIIFLLARIPILFAMPFESLRGFGDLEHFYNLAAIPGLPNIHYWVEYPPGFAFLNEFLYFLSRGSEISFTYLLVMLLFVADIGSVLIFQWLEHKLYPTEVMPTWRSLVFAAMLAGLPYSWWYFDPLAVFFMLLSILLVIRKSRPIFLGLALGVGIMIKLFPALLLPALLRSLPLRRGAIIASIALLVFIIPLSVLNSISPTFTRASLASQAVRGSVETIWALLDNNYLTGLFGPLTDRVDPAKAFISTRNPAVISPWLLLVIFGAVGIYLWSKSRLDTGRNIISLIGITFVLFFLWSPAWSPQWVLYFIPSIILVLPQFPGLPLVTALMLVNLLEWPIFLARGLSFTLPLTVILRYLIFILLGIHFYKYSRQGDIEVMQ